MMGTLALRRAYHSAAFHQRTKQRLQDALSVLEKKCLPPQTALAETDDLHRAMMQMTWWPSADLFAELDSSVETLAMFDREKVPKPLWKAIKLVNQRWPGYRLISRLNALVSRARKLLEEAGESDLALVCREADGSGERASEAKRFLIDLRRIQKDIRAAAKIKWQEYEHFLFVPGNKRIELACKLIAPPGVKCYARALEVIVGDERREPLRNKARPLLEWVARVGNTAYSDLLKWDDFAEWIAEVDGERAVAERVQRKRAQVRERQRRYRKGKIAR